MTPRRLLGLHALVATATLLSSCNAPEPQMGTNTNWLRACDEDTPCGDTGTCLCGRCTVECRSDADCPDTLGCSSALGAQSQCSGKTSPPICLHPCTSDGDCEKSEHCVTGSCTTPLPTLACPLGSTTLACSAFNDDTLGGWTTAVDSAATLESTSAPVFEGAGALHSVWPGRAIAEQSLAAVTTGTLYGRFWLRVAGTAPRAHLAQLDGDTGEVALRLVVEGPRAWVETTTGAVPGETNGLTPSVWHCVRFTIGLSDTEGTLQVWLDESLFVDVQALDSLPEAGVTGLQLGVGWADAATELYADDAWLSTEPVGCF